MNWVSLNMFDVHEIFWLTAASIGYVGMYNALIGAYYLYLTDFINIISTVD